MRIVKTPEELALWRRAYVYFDRAHAFARDYILTHGTDITDYEVAMATQFWINQQLYSDLKLANGAPHRGVKSGVEVEVRAGPFTAYPTPTSLTSTASDAAWPCKFQEERTSEATAEKITACTSSPTRRATSIPHVPKLWEVSQRCCDMQVELQSEGSTCASVAYKIHKYQVGNGVQKYIYHRPAHVTRTGFCPRRWMRGRRATWSRIGQRPVSGRRRNRGVERRRSCSPRRRRRHSRCGSSSPRRPACRRLAQARAPCADRRGSPADATCRARSSPPRSRSRGRSPLPALRPRRGSTLAGARARRDLRAEVNGAALRMSHGSRRHTRSSARSRLSVCHGSQMLAGASRTASSVASRRSVIPPK